MQKTRKQKIIKIGLVTTVTIVIALLVTILLGFIAYKNFVQVANQGVSFAVPVPGNWSLVEEKGSIASFCAGSWSECGQIERVYVIKDSESAVNELKQKTQQSGWILEETRREDGSIYFTAKDSRENWNEIGYVTVTNSVVTIVYEKR